MTKRPDNFPPVTPYITVKNIDGVLTFYQKAFNFVLKEKVPDSENNTLTAHAEMLYQDQVLMFGREGAYSGLTKAPISLGLDYPPIALYVYCDDVDAIYAQAIKAGAQSITAPEDMFWGDRTCRLKCPEGYIWAFATYSGECKNQVKS